MVWVGVIPLGVLAGTWALAGLVRRWLLGRAILDRPVERSSHRIPTPRGGGLAVVPVLAAGWLILAALGQAPAGAALAIGAAIGLALLSWLDDLRNLSVGVRLLGHLAAVAVGLASLPDGSVFQGALPPFLDRVAAALLWVWFVNLFNFMDGIDGITGVETAAIGVGTAMIAGVTGDSGGMALALCATAGAAGFLRWNWHPAKLFLGDVGSVPLGFLLGWLLLDLAIKGLWAPALILPLYYLADATLTLAARVLRGERFWQAHSHHFYQRALGRDGNHAAVASYVLIGDAILVASAALALTFPLPALGLAALTVAALLAALERRARR